MVRSRIYAPRVPLMNKRRVCVWLIVALLLGLAVLLAWFEPNRICRGLLAGEPFYRDRPLSYWKRSCAGTGRRPRPRRDRSPIPRRQLGLPCPSRIRQRPRPQRPLARHLPGGIQRATNAAGPGPAGGGDRPRRRGEAEGGNRPRPLGAGGAAGRTCPRVRLQDPEAQVAHYADLALWAVDQPAAVAASGYRTFSSSEFGFSVALPGEPEREDRPPQRRALPTRTRSANGTASAASRPRPATSSSSWNARRAQ